MFTWTPGYSWAWNKTSKFLYDTCREVDNRRRWTCPKCKWPCTIPWMLHLTWQTDCLSSGTQWRTMFRVADSFNLNPRWLTTDIRAARQLMETERTENGNPIVWKYYESTDGGTWALNQAQGPSKHDHLCSSTGLMLRKLAGHKTREESICDPQCAWENYHQHVSYYRASLQHVRCDQAEWAQARVGCSLTLCCWEEHPLSIISRDVQTVGSFYLDQFLLPSCRPKVSPRVQ